MDNLAEKRVQIAQDVLDAIEQHTLLATKGTMFSSSLWSRLQAMKKTCPEAEVQTVLEEQETCAVCAKGALFVAAITRYDNFKCRDVPPNSFYGGAQQNQLAVQGLSPFFSKEQLNEIEIAFEGAVAYYLKDYSDPIQLAKLLNFNDVSASPHERMRKIMQNIVDNKGTFAYD